MFANSTYINSFFNDDELQFTPPASQPRNQDAITLQKVGITKGWMITAGDISSDGKKVLLRNYLSKK